MRSNRPARIDNVRYVGLAILVEGSGNANHDRLDFPHARKVRRCRESPGFHRGPNRLGGDVFDVAASMVQRLDFRFVYIESQYVYAGASELQRQRKPHVAEANDADFHEEESTRSGPFLR